MTPRSWAGPFATWACRARRVVNVIVRQGEAIPPRGSTEIEAGDELHILVRGEVRNEVERADAALARGADRRAASPAAAAAQLAADLQRAPLDR